MLQQLRQLTMPIAISIAFYDATFLVIADLLDFTQRDVLLGVTAGAASGVCVLAAVLWQVAASPSRC
jgi:hypothetical protein